MANRIELWNERVPSDLWSKTFYACTQCGNYVGTHRDSGKPLGSIPTRELRQARSRLHRVIDPLWKERGLKRRDIYARISQHIGREFHSAQTRSVGEVKDIIEFVQREFC